MASYFFRSTQTNPPYNFELLNHSCNRNDRRNGLRWGGIAFYCKKGITTYFTLKSNADSSTEFLGIEVQAMNHQKYVLIGLNRSKNMESLAIN